jgi:hypothetical protein
MFSLGEKNRAVRDKLSIGDDKVKKFWAQYEKDQEERRLAEEVLTLTTEL